MQRIGNLVDLEKCCKMYYLVAKFCFDTAENEPFKVCPLRVQIPQVCCCMMFLPASRLFEIAHSHFEKKGARQFQTELKRLVTAILQVQRLVGSPPCRSYPAARCARFFCVDLKYPSDKILFPIGI